MAACTCPSTTRRWTTPCSRACARPPRARLRRAGLPDPVAVHRRHPAADLKALCAKTYTAEVFGTGEIVPLRHLENSLWLEAPSNGPTLAFKDMAMQLLGNLFEYELGRRVPS